MSELFSFTPTLTADGSFTFFSEEFGETFHSHYGARQEAEFKFVKPTQLAEKAQQPRVRILDICYGLGYNTASALESIWAVNPRCRVEWVGLELDPEVPKAAIAHHLLESWRSPIPEILTELGEEPNTQGQQKRDISCSERTLESETFRATLWIGDARQTIQKAIASGFEADAVFLDPFSPPSCPQLWTVEFLALVARSLNSHGRVATYSCSAAVRTALMAAGLQIGSTAPVGRRSPGTVASFTSIDLPTLSQQEQEHLQTRAAIPYRDPTLSDLPEAIRQRRQNEQHASPLQSTSSWKKKWMSLGEK